MPARSRWAKPFAGGRRAVVVLAHRDVAAAAGEIDLEHAFLLLHGFAGHAQEVRGHRAVTAERLGMPGVVVYAHQGLGAAGEGDGSDEGINVALGRFLELAIAAVGTPAHRDLAVGPLQAAGAGDALDAGLARAHPIKRLQPGVAALTAAANLSVRSLRNLSLMESGGAASFLTIW